MIPEPSVEEYEECIEAFQDIMAGYGHTSAFDPLVEINGNLHKAYRKMDAEGRLKIKFGIAYASDLEHPEESVRSYGSAAPVFGEKLI